MVFRLAADLYQAESAVGVKCGAGEHFQEIGLSYVVGAGAGDEDAAGAEHFEGAEIELFVAAQGGVEVALALGERGWVENDGVVVTVGGGVVLEEVKGVGFDPFNLFSFQELVVERGVLVGYFEGGTGAVDASDLRARGARWRAKPP